MVISTRDEKAACEAKYPILLSLRSRAAFLFGNFFLIILALYQLKPASRSLFIESWGASHLPYVWILTALTFVVFIAYYHRLVERCSRLKVVLGTCLVFSGLLILFRVLSSHPGRIVSTCLYILVDIVGVVLVEQFWSLTNSVYTTREGKAWYGFVGTGGLVGGVIGGSVSAIFIKMTPLQTPDLLLTAAGTILLIFLLTWVMGRIGLYCEVDYVAPLDRAGTSWRILRRSRYFLLIAAILLLAQLASPLVEYQFLNGVEAYYPAREDRTAFLSMFFGLMGLISVGVNLGITPIIHRYLGAIGGLLVQPFMISLCSWVFFLHSSLFFGSTTRICDRALSYSINRASRELLYVPVDPVLIYQAKAWIDMFGYRLFKVAGSVLILLFTQWLPFKISVVQLSWFTISICVLWVAVIVVLRHEYRLVCQEN